MAESRLVPCNLLAWPAIRDLLPDQKLLVYHMWVTCPSAAGCFLLDYAGFQGALSITANAVEDAVMEFERRGLIAYDRSTGEVFILSWFRWHKFDTATRRRLLEDAVKKVESPRLKSMIYEKSMTYVSREGKEREGNINTPPSPPPQRGASGPAGAGQGVGGGVDKEGEKAKGLLPDAKQAIEDEEAGRREAIARNEAPPVNDWAAWRRRLAERAYAGEDIRTERGMLVAKRREAASREDQRQAAKHAAIQETETRNQQLWSRFEVRAADEQQGILDRFMDWLSALGKKEVADIFQKRGLSHAWPKSEFLVFLQSEMDQPVTTG